MEHWAKIRLRIAFNAVWIHFGSSGIEIDTTLRSFPTVPYLLMKNTFPWTLSKKLTDLFQIEMTFFHNSISSY